MIWLKRLLLFFIVPLLFIVVVCSTAVYFMNEQDIKDALAWLANSAFDSQLVIEGDLSVNYSDGLNIQVGEVKLVAHDQSFQYSSASLSATIRLRPLLHETLWLDTLDADKVYLKFHETESEAVEWSELELPKIIVAQADISALTVEYQEIPPGTLHRYTLEDLQLGDVGRNDNIKVQASGTFEGDPVQLAGTLPSVGSLSDTDTPKPVELTLKGEHGYVTVNGTVIDPINGEGLEMSIDLSVSNTENLLELLDDNIPELGELKASATLRGTYSEPRLENIHASVTRDQKVSMEITGSVDNMFTGEGLSLHITGKSSQPSVVSWLVFDQMDKLDSLDFTGDLYEKSGNFYISSLDVDAKSKTGFALSLSGDSQIYSEDHLLVKTDSGLKVRFSAPDTTAVNFLEGINIPALGPTSGNFLLQLSADEASVRDAELSIGNKSGTIIRASGQVGQIPFEKGRNVSGIGVKLTLQSEDIAKFANRFNYKLPAIGKGQGSMTASGSLDKLALKNVKLEAGGTDSIQYSANGQVGSLSVTDGVKLENAVFDVTADASDFSKLSDLADRELPSLGATRASSQVTVKQSQLTFENINVNIGRQDQPTVRVNGDVTVQLDKSIRVNIQYNVAVADLAAIYTDKPPGYLGRLQGSADISDIDGSWGIETFNLKSSQTSLYQIDIHGGIDDIKNKDQVDIKVNFSIDDPDALGRALGINLAGVGAYRETGRFSSKQNRIVYNGEMSIGKSSGSTRFSGHTDKAVPYFSGTLSFPVIDLTDFGFGVEEEVKYDVIAKPEQSGKDYLFSRETLNIDILNSFALDLELQIDEVESYGKSSIDSVKGTVSLHDGVLTIEPLRFVYIGGTLDISANVKASEQPTYAFNVVADDLIFGPLLSERKSDATIEGRTNIKLDVDSEGRSAHEIASNLNGDINVEIENVRLPSKLMDLLSVDVFGWVMSSTFSDQKYVNLNCVVAQFTANKGQVNSSLLVADGPNMSLGGRVDLDLTDETIKATLYPKQKKRLFSTITPVKLSGSIRDPDVVAIPAQAALQEIGAIALSPTIYLSARLLEKIWGGISSQDDVGEGCVNVDKMTDEAEKASKKAAAN